MRKKKSVKLKVEISDALADEIIVRSLKQTAKGLRRDLKRRATGKDLLGVYYSDVNEDLRAINKTLKAVRRVLGYYGG